VTNDTEVPSRAMALGIPAKIVLDKVDPAMVAAAAEKYLKRAVSYRHDLRRLD
jgi:hypothetical protein